MANCIEIGMVIELIMADGVENRDEDGDGKWYGDWK